MNQPMNTEIPCPEPGPESGPEPTPVQVRKKKNQSSLIVWAALLLGLVTPFGLYYALQNGFLLLAGIFFGLLAFSMGLTAWKG